MDRQLSSFPLPPALKLKLKTNGLLRAQDVLELSATELSSILDVGNSEGLSILQIVRGETTKGQELLKSGTSVLDLLNNEVNQQPITTFSQRLDDLLGGGVPLGKITEFCGAPGVGKTQLCIQLCVDVQIPSCFGGVEGEAVYIDTEGSFIIDRVVDVAKGAVTHCEWVAKTQATTEQVERLAGLKFEAFLQGLYYFRCLDNTQLLALGHVLPDFLQEHPRVRVIVVDSIAFHFRHGFNDWSLRTRLLNGLAQQFIQMATKHHVAVVLTNQMTTKIDHGESRLSPALGESWGHASTIRVILHWNGKQRQALLYKSPTQKESVVPYQITVAGVRDITLNAESSSSTNLTKEKKYSEGESRGEQQAQKRQRTQ